jgi:prepilin-type N-terminal cleavage/methylation domain-containing protein
MEEIMDKKIRTSQKQTEKGFTLVELMIVIAIISILASLSAPKLTRQVAKANLVSVHNLANQNQAAIEEFIMINDSYPSSSEFVNWLISDSSDSHINGISLNNSDGTSGNLKITLNELPGLDSGHYFLFSRSEDANWQCTSSLSSDYLPNHCSTVESDDAEEDL